MTELCRGFLTAVKTTGSVEFTAGCLLCFSKFCGFIKGSLSCTNMHLLLWSGAAGLQEGTEMWKKYKQMYEELHFNIKE